MKRTGNQLPLDEGGAATKAASRAASTSAETNTDAVSQVERLAKDVKAALAALQGLRNLAKDPVKNATRIRAQVTRTRDAVAKLPVEQRRGADAWIDDTMRVLDERDARTAKSFATDLDAALREKKIRLGGNLPLLEASYFKVEVGDSDVRISFGPQRELLRTTAKDATTVADAIESLIGEFDAEALDDQRFHQLVYRAYRAALAVSDAKPGDPVAVDAVHRQLILLRQDKAFPLNQKLRAYSRARFGYDLYRHKQRSHKGMAMQLTIAAKSRTERAQDSIWVPSDDMGRGALYAQINFKEA